MTAGLVIGNRRIGPATLLIALTGLAIVVALITPEPGDESRGGRTSYSTAPGGTRIVYELAERMGWQASRRVTPLDSIPTDVRSVQVVIDPEITLGAAEVHRLLDNVRRGGGLIFDVRGSAEIADSLGMEFGKPQASLTLSFADPECRGTESFGRRPAFILPPTVHKLQWRRPPPGDITPILVSGRNRSPTIVASAFPMGAGRVVAIGSADLFGNYFVRTCGWGVDVVAARALEFVRPPGVGRPRIVFDEFHHGYGAHGGSLQAISRYLSRTASGHFLAQALIAALILLLAKAPRPIAPREPERIPRRSPLEHADALAHAYADVRATRTATARLVGGLRRRAGRTVPVHAAVTDAAFLDAVIRRTPGLAPHVRVVQRALTETLTARDFAAVGGAIREIEDRLTTSPPSQS